MASGFSLIGLTMSLVYVALAVAFAVFADRIYGSRPIGLWGDVGVAALANAVFAIFLGDGWRRMLLELNDAYPDYFAVAYMPVVAFVSIGFVRSLMPLLPARGGQRAPAMAMAVSGHESTGGTLNAVPASSGPLPVSDAAPGQPGAKPPSAVMKWTKLIVGVVLLAVIVLIGLARFITRNDLPNCTAQSTRDTLSNIYQAKKFEVKRYDEIRTISTSDSKITCTAFVTMADGHKAEVDYQLTFDADKNAELKITGARDK